MWTKSDVNKPDDACNVDLIELPRLQLTFFSKVDSDGSLRLYLLFTTVHLAWLTTVGLAVIMWECILATSEIVYKDCLLAFLILLYLKVSVLRLFIYEIILLLY